METIQEWFEIARDRHIPPLLTIPNGDVVLNLGAGGRPIVGCHNELDLEHGVDLNAGLPMYDSESVDGIIAHACFGYIEDPIALLAECQRVLRPGGVMNIVEPHALSDLWAEDVRRRSRFTEETWKNLFENRYWDSQAGTGAPRLDFLHVHACFIIGVVWRNLSLFTQLVKVEP